MGTSFVSTKFLFLILIVTTSADYKSYPELSSALFKGVLTPFEQVVAAVGQQFAWPPFNETLQFYCANPNSFQFHQVFMDDPYLKQKLNVTLPMGFLIHGWLDSSNVQWMLDVSSEWLQYRGGNICRVNWIRLSRAIYEVASTVNVRAVASYLTEFIQYLETAAGIQPENITLVGHSLGAQVSGMVGYNLRGRLKMIVALDAAGIYFTTPVLLPNNYRLDATDAQQVVVIHSCDGVLGVNYPSGHQDFYANTGFFPQRECIWPLLHFTYQRDPVTCAHYRAIDYFRSSLNPENNCRALQCDNLLLYWTKTCQNLESRIGLDATKGDNGQFYFATTREHPATCTGVIW